MHLRMIQPNRHSTRFGQNDEAAMLTTSDMDLKNLSLPGMTGFSSGSTGRIQDVTIRRIEKKAIKIPIQSGRKPTPGPGTALP